MQKYHKKHNNVHYINKNYVLKPIYNDENECINDMLREKFRGGFVSTMRDEVTEMELDW